MQVDLDSVRRLQKDNLADVLDAVQSGLATGNTGSGSKRAQPVCTLAQGKRRRIDPLLEISDLEDSSEEEDDEGAEVAEGQGAGQEGGVAPSGGSSQAEMTAGPSSDGSGGEGSKEEEDVVQVPAQQQQQAAKAQKSQTEVQKVDFPAAALHDAPPAPQDHLPAAVADGAQHGDAPAVPGSGAAGGRQQSGVGGDASPPVPIDLTQYGSAADLEALGLDCLKAELSRQGLKCGGDLKQRAARLFLLKHTPLDQLDRKHLAGAKP